MVNPKVFRMPTVEPSLVGKAQLSDFYATQRFNRPAPRAQPLSRIVISWFFAAG
ncbi:steroid Delta-isomerase [Cystobacter fuscus]|uniref:Steroid Delta-isomerase n=1 Tax=Cystobacter fuscus TaxID=43 RepID=A0A250J9R7_9BACT|nr:hypothetical protein [Cystobacter fuscus]ATB40300.1 steroid Delta-isomerase [Cystobacter fuscus]